MEVIPSIIYHYLCIISNLGSLTSILIFDGNMVSHWKTFIHLKGAGRLGSKMSNVTNLISYIFFHDILETFR